MKVFVDLGKQICGEDGPQFAFYCTVHGCFESFLGEQVWCSKEDFEDAYKLQKLTDAGIERYLSLIPEQWGIKNKMDWKSVQGSLSNGKKIRDLSDLDTSRILRYVPINERG